MDPHDDSILWKDYERHQTKQPEKVFDFLQRIVGDFRACPTTGLASSLPVAAATWSSRLLKKGVSVKLPCRWSQEHDDVRL